jgi:succinate-semialdehyde dehydrogenase / glutarate-semialdehyde dehydrogenase
MLNSINPANQQIIKTYPQMSPFEVSEIIDLTNGAFEEWRQTSFSLRSELMMKAANILREKKEEYSRMMTLEMGKPIAQSRAEIDKCAWVCEYYAENAEKFLSDELIATDASKSFVTFQPLGIVLAVMPWNFPFWQVFRFAAPGLMAGNAGILKHASNVSGCALAIEEVFRKAGFPENLFRTILLPSSQMERVIENEKIKAVTLTGSVPAGKAVAKTAGSALKKTVMELGGSDPYIILEDADLEMAADTCVTARLINGGQSCIAAKRFIVVEKVYESFENLFVEKMKTKKMGDPFDESNYIGPQASVPLRDELHQQIEKSIELGAKLSLGGKIPEMKGAWYPPTVLTNVKKVMPAYDEELFGPVAALIKAKDEEEAIQIANDSIFGLGASVFTRDLKKGEMIAKEKIHAGCCFVNAFVKSDPRLPFGGIKESGYGRELSSFGIREFVNIKTIYIK